LPPEGGLVRTECCGGVRSRRAPSDGPQPGFVELTERAKSAGGLREDFVPEDLIMLLMANDG
jgi:hypothetical protein